MGLRFLIIFLAFAVSVSGETGETLETIRRQFEIYQRHSGELEILSTENLKEIDNVLKRTETKRLIVRKALDQKQTAAIPKKDVSSPLFVGNDAVPFRHYAAVERAFAKQSLRRGKPDDAMQAIQYTYRLADVLSESGSLELRTVAAMIRLQMLEVVQSLLLDPLCRKEHHQLLHTLFEGQINGATDQTIWARYREEGKHFFEATARNGIEKTVSPNLLQTLQERHALDEYEKAPVERFAHDQSVFLQVMSAVIESCESPFYQRQSILRHLNNELRERQGTATEPVFALLLLRDVSESMRLFAQEQVGNEMVYLALSASLNGPPRRNTMNFLTGDQYEFPLITDGIMCTYKGNIKPFYVPYR